MKSAATNTVQPAADPVVPTASTASLSDEGWIPPLRSISVWIDGNEVVLSDYKVGDGRQCKKGDEVTIAFVASDLDQSEWYNGDNMEPRTYTFRIGQDGLPTSKSAFVAMLLLLISASIEWRN
jgi:hypothetical protein